MKKFIFTILIPVMFLTITGCGLLNNNAALNAQSDNSTANALTGNQPEIASAQNNTQSTDIQPAQGKMIEVTLYFATEDNRAVKAEKREVQVVDGAILKACTQALLEGPKTAILHKTIPDGTKLIGVNRKDNVAIVDFSKEYSTTNDVAEVTKRISIVNTLTEISGIDKVIFRVEGKELISPSGEPVGEMSRTTLDSNELPSAWGQK